MDYIPNMMLWDIPNFYPIYIPWNILILSPIFFQVESFPRHGDALRPPGPDAGNATVPDSPQLLPHGATDSPSARAVQDLAPLEVPGTRHRFDARGMTSWIPWRRFKVTPKKNPRFWWFLLYFFDVICINHPVEFRKYAIQQHLRKAYRTGYMFRTS